MKVLRQLQLERLEDRAVPSIFGNPWPDGQHLTLSFAPDGTGIAGAPSALSQTLSPMGDTAAKTEILRAIQSWAVNANVNIGLLGDNGADFNTGGAFQGDPRFGDIRIGAKTLGNEVLAITAPFEYFSSYSGNIVLNGGAPLSIGGTNGTYDLFTIFLQETGHSLGVGNSLDPASVMYETYSGVRTGLSAGDVASLQALYGRRTADSYEGIAGNATLATATRYSGPLDADLTTTGDVDVYRYSAPLLSTGTVVRLEAQGVSLVQAKVELLDASGRVVASSTANSSFDNDVTVNFSKLDLLGGTYFVRVRSNRGDVFGVGSYHLTVQCANILAPVTNLLDPEVGLNDLLGSATNLLQTVTGTSAQIDYNLRSSFSTGSDVDYYKIHSPAATGTDPVNLIATIWGLNGANLNPRLDVYDAAGNRLNAQVLTNNDGSFTVQALNVTPQADYFLRASSDTQAVGNYSMAVDFRGTAVTFPMGAAGTLGGTAHTTSQLSVIQSQQIHLVLSSDVTANGGATVQLTVRDSAGNVVYQLKSAAGESQSGDVYLTPGTYTVTIGLISTTSSAPPTTQFWLQALAMTDPVGAQTVDTTSAPAGDSSSSTSSSSPPPSSNDQYASYWSPSSPSDSTYWY